MDTKKDILSIKTKYQEILAVKEGYKRRNFSNIKWNDIREF